MESEDQPHYDYMIYMSDKFKTPITSQAQSSAILTFWKKVKIVYNTHKWEAFYVYCAANKLLKTYLIEAKITSKTHWNSSVVVGSKKAEEIVF